MKNKAKYTDYIAEYLKNERGNYLVRLFDNQLISATTLTELRASVLEYADGDTYKQTLDYLNHLCDWKYSIEILPHVQAYVYEVTPTKVVYRYNYEIRTKVAKRTDSYFRTRDFGRLYLKRCWK